MPSSPEPGIANKASPVWLALVGAAAVVGLTLLLDSIHWSSATYDEVAYLRVGARWWRTGACIRHAARSVLDLLATPGTSARRR